MIANAISWLARPLESRRQHNDYTDNDDTDDDVKTTTMTTMFTRMIKREMESPLTMSSIHDTRVNTGNYGQWVALRGFVNEE